MKILHRLITLIFPERCPYCGTLIEPERIACDSCLEELKRKRVPIKSGAGGFRCVSSFVYGGRVRRMILRMKYRDRTQYIPQIAAVMAEDIRSCFPSVVFDLITSVPMTERDRIERGYNQSELLAESLSKLMDIPYRDILIKVKKTQKQHKLTYAARKTNLSGAFKVRDKGAVNGTSILIIDDIITSGNTLAACCKAINKAKPKAIYCATIASAKISYPDNTII